MQIQERPEFISPLNLPSKSVVAGKFPPLRRLLHNHLRMIQQWDWGIEPECRCATHLQQHPDLQTVDGYVASPASLLNVSRRMRLLLQYSADAQVYPSISQYIQDSWPRVQRWSRYFGLNNISSASWEAFIKSQWKEHAQTTWTSINDSSVRFLEQIMAPFFIHGRDHAVTHCHVIAHCLRGPFTRKPLEIR